ncbi:MAG: shikimate dehydrogenase (NADP+), partial [Myxococcales bacterium]|nr:shikimate dehydrogenase (NADP+) [Myxococcales bacterium]
MVLGIFGWPVEHSRSPAMHNAALAAVGLDATYVPFAVRPDALGRAVEGVRALGIRGVNVTLPHKQAIVPLLDELDEAARAIGAVNTVSHERGRLLGSNTDAPGLVRALEAAGVRAAGARVVVLGAGGAARA